MRRVCLRCKAALCSDCGACHQVECRWYVPKVPCWGLPAHPTAAQRRAMLCASVLADVRCYEQTLLQRYLAHAPYSWAEYDEQERMVEVVLRLVLERVGVLLPVEVWQVVQRLFELHLTIAVPIEDGQVSS